MQSIFVAVVVVVAVVVGVGVAVIGGSMFYIERKGDRAGARSARRAGR